MGIIAFIPLDSRTLNSIFTIMRIMDYSTSHWRKLIALPLFGCLFEQREAISYFFGAFSFFYLYVHILALEILHMRGSALSRQTHRSFFFISEFNNIKIFFLCFLINIIPRVLSLNNARLSFSPVTLIMAISYNKFVSYKARLLILCISLLIIIFLLLLKNKLLIYLNYFCLSACLGFFCAI